MVLDVPRGACYHFGYLIETMTARLATAAVLALVRERARGGVAHSDIKQGA